jgi:hypothetical protein
MIGSSIVYSTTARRTIIKKPFLVFIIVAVTISVGIWSVNYLKLQAKVNAAIASDQRTGGLKISAHYGHYIEPSTLVFELKPLPSDKNFPDVYRVFLDFAGRVNLSKFRSVDLLYAGRTSPDVLQREYDLQRDLLATEQSDPRNNGLEGYVYLAGLNDPSTLVYDMERVSGSNSMADVFRLFLQFAERRKNDTYVAVLLVFRGKTRFKMKGAYYKQLGEEFSYQNAVYTVRTFPENLTNPDATPAYSTWTGGLLGVVNKQMEDFNDFHRKWWLDESTKDLSEPSGSRPMPSKELR